MKSRSALQFVVIIGIANFFADFTYEGARGIVGPFLGSLGASAAIVGFVAGLGELMGYGLRSVSGYFADKSRRHWGFAFAGYAVNMLAVPALALAGRWPVAASLVVAERVGRGIRKSTVEAMLSYAGKSIGAGWVFGLNEALDQAGATVGPLLVALILYLNGGFSNWIRCAARSGFALPRDLGRGKVAASTTARVGGRHRAHIRDNESDVPLLDLSRSRLANRRWFRRLRADRFSLSQGQHGAPKHDSRLLCSCNGEQRARFNPVGAIV